jgi:hypothetical protein
MLPLRVNCAVFPRRVTLLAEAVEYRLKPAPNGVTSRHLLVLLPQSLTLFDHQNFVAAVTVESGFVSHTATFHAESIVDLLLLW